MHETVFVRRLLCSRSGDDLQLGPHIKEITLFHGTPWKHSHITIAVSFMVPGVVIVVTPVPCFWIYGESFYGISCLRHVSYAHKIIVVWLNKNHTYTSFIRSVRTYVWVVFRRILFHQSSNLHFTRNKKNVFTMARKRALGKE